MGESIDNGAFQKGLREEIEKIQGEEEAEALIKSINEDMPWFFGPCPDCERARNCYEQFLEKPPKSWDSKKRYFKDWIARCVTISGVRPRQELLFLVDEWSGHVFRPSEPSYRYIVGKCLEEIVDEPDYDIHLVTRNATNFYHADGFNDDVERLIQDRVKLTQKLKSYGTEIGDCLLNIVAEYFERLGEKNVRTKVPMNSAKLSQASGEMDIDVLTDKYMIETRNHAHPLDTGSLDIVLNKYREWEAKGFDRKRVLVCSRVWGSEIRPECQKEGVLLIVVGLQVIPEILFKEVYGESAYKHKVLCAADSSWRRRLIWARMQNVFKHPKYSSELMALDIKE